MSKAQRSGTTGKVTRLKRTAGKAAAARSATPTAFRPQTTSQDYPVDEALRQRDQMMRAALARLTGGVSPVSLARAYVDWAANLMLAPGKQANLTRNAARQLARFWMHSGRRLAGQSDHPVIELIQYAPSTEAVHPQPALIVPAWVNPQPDTLSSARHRGPTCTVLARTPDLFDACKVWAKNEAVPFLKKRFVS